MSIQQLFLIFIYLFSIQLVYAESDYEYSEIKNGNQFTYKKIISQDSKQGCEVILFITRYETKSVGITLKYSCFFNKNVIHQGKGKSTLSMEQVMNEFSMLIEHYNLAKEFKLSSHLRFVSLHDNLSEPYFLKFINQEKSWNRKLYETSSFDLYRESVRELILKSKVYEPLVKLLNSYGYKLSVKKYFSEHLMHRGKPELLDKEFILESGFIKKINKEKYPFINWVGFDMEKI